MFGLQPKRLLCSQHKICVNLIVHISETLGWGVILGHLVRGSGVSGHLCELMDPQDGSQLKSVR